ncbi:MAG: hypothetical protein HZA66_22115 [Rhodopseudomonas palustris]|uniref:Uncharacterized protein n=1 Tax=Rhodopseudomonas palustris TaxID=1076 RepID=A0A933S101_RHOPL|nr:hypothetical protein [Rhodopseudomonas palustris]
MTRFALCCAAVAVCLTLPLTSLAGVAAESGAHKGQAKHGRSGDPMQASASMPGAAVAVRYDSACRAKYAISSVGYHDCLQRLPATALIGGR